MPKVVSDSIAGVKNLLFAGNTQDPPCVVGYPRTGFTLLISIIIEIYNLHSIRQNRILSPETELIFQQFSSGINRRIAQLLDDLKVSNDLIFNQNFHPPLGGPNWLDADKNRLCVRKYIGFKDLGDLTVVIALPLDLINNHQVPHSHGPLAPWLNNSKNQKIFHSIRSPAGTINSACHSINAIASEYIQRWKPNLSSEEEEKIRVDLALSKLTDLKFFKAMALPMKKSFVDLANSIEHVYLHHWEDIILEPVTIILKVSSQLDLKISTEQAQEIWCKIGYKNLTQAHKHNYRAHGVNVQGHLKALTNHHMKILMELGFEDLALKCGVEPPALIDENDYTEFQKQVAQAIEAGKVVDNIEDQELYWFSFQKTNIDFNQFHFRTFEWKKYSRLERTNIQHDELIFGIWEIYEGMVQTLIERLKSQ